MDNDTISRQAAIDALDKRFDSIPMEQTAEILQLRKDLRELPSAQPERMKGKWKTALLDHEAFGVRPKVLYCSECNQCIAYPTRYCPNCGADMRGEQDE